MDYLFQISRWAVVNHGQALKTDQILARKQFPQNVILPPSTNCLHRQKPTVFTQFLKFCLFWGKTTMSVVRGSLFQGAPGPDVQASEFVPTVQNSKEHLKS